MWNPFKQPIKGSLVSGDPDYGGGPGQEFVLAEAVTVDSADWPDEPNTVENTVATWRGNADDRFQQNNANTPSYAGSWMNHPGQAEEMIPGQQFGYQYLIPAAGSQDLAMPRQSGGVPGTNTLMYSAAGPVTGDNSRYDNTRAAMYSETPGYNGPVGGGPDYSQMATRAYFQQQAAAFSQQYAEAAMLASI